ncbi:MAG: miaA [Bacteroidota bacterium]|nr:miaA [Bacteroidota bacterium]
MDSRHSIFNIQHSKFLIIIAGPTAVGKTHIAIEVAKHFQAEIISADSRQLFKELDIGVARPGEEELKEIKHHFIANKSIHEYVSAGEYEREVIDLLDKLFKEQNVVVMCGGTGFYIDAVCNGFDEIPDVDEKIREELNATFRNEGIGVLQEKLKQLDTDTYNNMDIQNSQRVIRALEVCIGTGKPLSFFKQKRKLDRSFIPIKICLNTDREKLYQNIDQRVDTMIKNGLTEEARSVYPFKENNALQTVGYKELFDHFENKITLEEAISKIKQNTRNYAKRQISWFKRDKDYKWFDSNDCSLIIKYIDEFIKQ